MSVRLYTLEPWTGRRVPLWEEGDTLTSLCAQVSPQAPVVVVYEDDRERGRVLAIAWRLRSWGFTNVTVERV